jgi:hypothetical protein
MSKPTFDLPCAHFEPSNDFSGCKYYDEPEDEREVGFCKRPDEYKCVSIIPKSLHLSQSSVNDYLTCHHLYWLKQIKGVQVKDEFKSAPLKMGTIWDRALQRYLGDKTIDMPAEINKVQIDEFSLAKVKGLFKAYKQLEIHVEEGGQLQAEIDMPITFDNTWGNGEKLELNVTGFYDRKYKNYFVENKFTSKPDNYLDPYFINSQVGTYFLADPSLDYCIMELARVPQLKSTGKNKEESADELMERIYQDAISRPSFYFIGYSAVNHTYGKKFHRSEFDLEELKSRYVHIFREIYNARCLNGWYRNDRVCNNVLPGIQCDMLGICRNNDNFNDATYYVREKKVKF